jgi:hypothetical protein
LKKKKETEEKTRVVGYTASELGYAVLFFKLVRTILAPTDPKLT